MKLGIMQPYFFPYIGYFSLIKSSDLFIAFDSIKYIRHGWIERNRVLKESDGWLYIHVPLKNRRSNSLINEVYINNELKWQKKIFAQLKHYQKTAPYYNQVIELLTNLFANNYQRIVDINIESLRIVCNYLGIKHNIIAFSEMNLQIEKPLEADEWALNICKSIGNVDEYLNLPGGKEFFDKTKYDEASIGLRFLEYEIKPYNQNRPVFEHCLSIIDVLMFNSVEEINDMIDSFVYS